MQYVIHTAAIMATESWEICMSCHAETANFQSILSMSAWKHSCSFNPSCKYRRNKNNHLKTCITQMNMLICYWPLDLQTKLVLLNIARYIQPICITEIESICCYSMRNISKLEKNVDEIINIMMVTIKRFSPVLFYNINDENQAWLEGHHVHNDPTCNNNMPCHVEGKMQLSFTCIFYTY